MAKEVINLGAITLREIWESSFTKHHTASEILKGHDLSGKIAVASKIIAISINETCLVTGANGGIGKETVKALAEVGADVILCCRNLEEGRKAAEDVSSLGLRGKVTVEQLDLANLRSVAALANTLQTLPRLDFLILNAGLMGCPLMHTTDGFEMQLGVNHIGHHYLTVTLLPKMMAQPFPSRVICVASEGHRMGHIDLHDPNFEHRPYSRWESYGQSKLANILFAKELAHRMKEAGANHVTACSLHPGFIKTGLNRHMTWMEQLSLIMIAPLTAKSASQGAGTTAYAAVATDLPSGAYLKDCKVSVPSNLAQDTNMAARLWEKTEELIKDALNK